MELGALPRMQHAVSGLVQAWEVRPNEEREREWKRERKEVCLFSTLLLICFYCWWNWALSERWGHNWIWLAFPWWSGNGSDVPVDWFVCLCDSKSVCVCVSMHKHGHGRFYWADISPLFSLWAGGDWWLNCWVHVNSNCWFIEILRVSEGAPTKRGRKRYRPFKLM